MLVQLLSNTDVLPLSQTLSGFACRLSEARRQCTFSMWPSGFLIDVMKLGVSTTGQQGYRGRASVFASFHSW